jgi:hypothetical protein
VVVCFVDIDGIVDHHCLNFLFIIDMNVYLWLITSICYYEKRKSLATYCHLLSSANKGGIMVFNASFNNISVISWRSVLLEEETRVPEENH